MRGKLSSTVLKTSTGSDTCAEFIQAKNRQEARKILSARVNEMKRSQRDAEYAAYRKAQMGNGSRSDKIRTYNFMESRVVDHRLDTKTHNIKAIMKGEFGLLFN